MSGFYRIIRTQQQKQAIFLGHIILTRAAHSVAEIRNRINPLWDPHAIPSGHSMSDHLRAIRFQIWKITQYKLSLQNLTRLADWKNGVWDQAEKLEQVRSAMETRLLSWVPEFTYPNDWLAFLVCSYPIDHYSGRKLSLDGVVPAIHPTVTVQPASTAGKPTRRDERASAASVPGTATHAAEEARTEFGIRDNVPNKYRTVFGTFCLVLGTLCSTFEKMSFWY